MYVVFPVMPNVSPNVCLSVCLSVFLSVSLSVFLSLCLSVCLSVSITYIKLPIGSLWKCHQRRVVRTDWMLEVIWMLQVLKEFFDGARWASFHSLTDVAVNWWGLRLLSQMCLWARKPTLHLWSDAFRADVQYWLWTSTRFMLSCSMSVNDLVLLVCHVLYVVVVVVVVVRLSKSLHYIDTFRQLLS